MAVPQPIERLSGPSLPGEMVVHTLRSRVAPTQGRLSLLARQEGKERDADFHAWLLEQADALRHRRYNCIHWCDLAEELEAMAAVDRREIKKYLKKLLVHLLKFRAQPHQLRRHHSWRKSIREAREDITDLIEDSPGIFQGKRDEFLAICYQRACADAAEETGILRDAFPRNCPWSFDQFMQSDFFPGINRST